MYCAFYLQFFYLCALLYLLCPFVILIKIINYLHKRSFIVRSLYNFTWLMCVVYFICSFQLRALLYVLCAFVILNKDYLLTYLHTKVRCCFVQAHVILSDSSYSTFHDIFTPCSSDPQCSPSFPCRTATRFDSSFLGLPSLIWTVISMYSICNIFIKTRTYAQTI